MASPFIYYPGGTSGARLATRTPIASSGRIWYVCNATSANGADAASPAGQQRTRPLLTTSQAITNSAAGDTIQYLEGHAESLAVTATFSKAGLKVWSEGTTDTRARFTLTAATTMFSATAAGVWFENLTFLTPTGTPATAQLNVAAVAGVIIRNVQFNVGNTATTGLNIATGASALRLYGVTFTSTSTTIATRPASGMVMAAGTSSDVEMDQVTFDGGTVAWSGNAFSGLQAVTRLTMIDCDFLNDSDGLLATGSVYTIHRRNTSGSSFLEIAA